MERQKKIKKYKLLDYMSDAFIESYGRSLEEAYSNAAMALTSVMVDLRRVSGRSIKESVSVKGFDHENLLYNWLETVLLKKDIEKKLFRYFDVKISKRHEGFYLTGVMHGEMVNESKHRFKRDVKAVTYHEMNIQHKQDKYYVRFLLDL